MVCITDVSLYFLQRMSVFSAPYLHWIQSITSQSHYVSDPRQVTSTNEICEIRWMDQRWLGMSPKGAMGAPGLSPVFQKSQQKPHSTHNVMAQAKTCLLWTEIKSTQRAVAMATAQEGEALTGSLVCPVLTKHTGNE